jgi:endonuclease YncB( thermonuclease family)
VIRRLFILALSCLALAAQARSFSGVVTHVTDGDTLWVRTARHGEPVKVRIQGIDAPESCQSGGAQAGAALKAHVLGQTVQLQSRARDDYGRMVARVSLHGQDVGRWMVARGHAWSYGWRGRAGPYAAEVRQAQAARRGLWAQAAVEPRVFRKRHGPCMPGTS